MPGLRTDEIVTDVSEKTATIADGASLTAAIDLLASRLGHIMVPAGIEGSAFSFEGSSNGTDFAPIHDEGAEYTVSMAASKSIAVKLDLFYRYRYIKVRTGTFASAQVQTGAAVLILGLYPR